MEPEGRNAPDGNANRATETNSTEDGVAGGRLPRRGFLRLGGAAVAAAGFSSVMGTAAAGGVDLMADPMPTDQAVGGGRHYRRKIRLRDADYNVWKRGMLLDALDDASRGDVVHVAKDAVIDLTGDSHISIPEGVTLASGRGVGGSPGGVIYTDSYDKVLFKTYKDDVRVTGLRLRGPRFGYYDTNGAFDSHQSQGVWFLGENCELDNCELFGWSVSGVSVGSRTRPRSAYIHHNSMHDNAMEGYGYGAMLYNGHSLVEHNYFNLNRHSICGFGYDTNGYEARYNLVGPKTVSHAFDMHTLSENTSAGGNLAGGDIYVHRNTFQFTKDILGRGQEAITIRGVPAGSARFERNWFLHGRKPDGDDVDQNGQAYRQANLDSDHWQNVYVEANHFGGHVASSDVGHNRPRDRRPARAISPGPRRTRSAVRVQYHNGFDDLVRLTNIKIEPASKKVAKLADHFWGEGQWQSEVHVKADLRNSTTDIGGGVSLPASIDLAEDGHSDSPHTTPIVSGGTDANVLLCDFLDRRGRPLDMAGRRMNVTVDFVLDGVGACRDEFYVEPTSG